LASITIRNLDDKLKQRLEARAAGRGQSMEEEARDILTEALQKSVSISASTNLYEAIRQIVEPLGGIEIDIPSRRSIREPPKFE
jgi:plasmid stability protein